jgi:hypothetical protein
MRRAMKWIYRTPPFPEWSIRKEDPMILVPRFRSQLAVGFHCGATQRNG